MSNLFWLNETVVSTGEVLRMTKGSLLADWQAGAHFEAISRTLCPSS